MESLRFGREIRWLFQAALLIFVVTIGLGLGRGIGLIEEFDQSQGLTHLHSGVIGWITLGIFGAGLWLFGGSEPRDGAEPWVTWTTVILILAAAVFVTGWWTGQWPIVAGGGSLVLLGIVMYLGWILREAGRLGFGRLTSPQLGILLALVALVVGSALGVLIAVGEASGAFEMPESTHLTHGETQISAYLILASMSLAYWRLHGNDRTRRGTWMAWLFFAGGVAIAIALLAEVLELSILYIPLDLTAFGLLLSLARARIVRPGWLAAGSARQYAIAIPFALAYLAVFIYLILGITALGLWSSPEEIPFSVIASTSHLLFLGVVTNVLFGLLVDFNRDRLRVWPWADHVLFWGMNLAVAAFSVAILAEADDLFRFITPVLGISVLVGVAAHSARMWAGTRGATAM
jgi:hypothetical protein